MLNSVAVEKAFAMMGTALPLMFLIIIIIIAATLALGRVFPVATGEEGDAESKAHGGLDE
jgi:hypothetical protein